MKKFFVFIVLLFGAPPLFGQGIDGLFDEEDFASELPEIRRSVEDQTETASSSSASVQGASSSVSSGTSLPALPRPQPASSGFAMPSAVPPLPTAALPAGAPAGAPAPASAPAAVPSAAPVPETISPSTEAGLLSRMSSAETSSLPDLGRGSSSSLPSLGNRRRKSDGEEHLSIFERRRRRAGNYQTDASNFDIAGVMLRMSPEEVMEVALANGFSLKFKNTKIPPFLQWKYKLECHKKNMIRFADVKHCIQETAQERKEEYVEKLVFEKPEYKETLTVDFTSMFADNGAYRIRYVNKGNHSWGNTYEGMFLKRKRRQDFWRAVIQKYGQPDDENAMIWSNSEEGASLEADLTLTFLDASLVLEDLSMTDTDSENMRAQDIKDGALNQFSF